VFVGVAVRVLPEVAVGLGVRVGVLVGVAVRVGVRVGVDVGPAAVTSKRTSSTKKLLMPPLLAKVSDWKVSVWLLPFAHALTLTVC
jgi:hypothetical protein